MKRNASNVARYFLLPFQLSIYFALTLVPRSFQGKGLGIKGLVQNAALSFLLERLASKSGTAQGRVEELISKNKDVPVYNITLQNDNVYYANGVLVNNCADSVVMTLSYTPIQNTVRSFEPS